MTLLPAHATPAPAHPVSPGLTPAPAQPEANGAGSAVSERSFIARNEPVEQLFRAIGAQAHKPVQLSAKAKQYRISGQFGLARPFDVIEQVTRDLGLTWYFDGRAIYVNDSSEMVSVVLSMPAQTADQLIAFLRAASLHDTRYPVKRAPGSGLVYLSGPPKYVEIVRSSAALLQQQDVGAAAGGRQVAVLKVHHALVIDRQFDQRDSSVVVPGLASVMRDVLGDRVVIAEVPADGGASPASSGQPASATRQPAYGTAALASADAADAPRSRALRSPPPLPTLAAPGAPATSVPPLPPNATIPTLAGLATFASQALTGVGAGTALATGATAPTPAPLLAGAFDDTAGGTRAMDAPLHVVAYGATNSLLLEGTAPQIAAAQRLVEQLDVPKTQVELSLWVIDISKSNLDALGAQWSANARIGTLGVQFNPQVLRHGSTLSHAQTLEFMASVTALSDANKARIVSRPILLAQDNCPAVFDNSRSFYVKLEGERVASLDKVTFGTMISVLPRICGHNGRIEMELSIEDGNSADPTEGSRLEVPVVSRTRIDTVARVLRDQSLLIGGYTHDETGERASRIPLLGDIPVLGHAFRYRENTDRQQVRLFLIQPRLVAEDSSFESERVPHPPLIDNAVDALKKQLQFDHV
ncbi:type III secretion system outer membrane ring subunit SctC [Burkholderia ambifaria]|uniref:type III secretion system outer membrane ring subunit SctC n=1 Tax=Burkholderia ambifaria TaxID=152480 RepID=UPI0015921683|nr:type III secretion system outer membrane ring subunit SctC [Burkholderia ambifaria]